MFRNKFNPGMLAVVLIALLVCFAPGIKAQIQFSQPDTTESKDQYNYILIYRDWVQGYKQNGDNMVIRSEWETKIKGFRNWDDLIKWLNSSNLYYTWGENRKQVRLGEESFIAIYDLSRTEKIKMELITEEKSLPKRIEIQGEKWTDYEWKERGKRK